jgi:hypothetical protein
VGLGLEPARNGRAPVAVGAPTQTKRGSNDLRFTLADGSALSLHVYRDRTHRIRVRRRAAPAEESQQARYRETAKVWRDYRRGAGFEVADEGTEGGYGWGSFVSTWARGIVGPSGYVEELPLPPGTVSRFNRSFELAGHLWYTCLNQRMLKVDQLLYGPYDAGVTMTAGAQTQDAIIFKDKAWIANGGSARIWSFDGTTWLPATDDVIRSRLCTTNWMIGGQMAGADMGIGKSYPVIIGYADGLYHCTGDPGTAADWVGPNVVGNAGAYGVQRLISTSEAAFALTPGGCYLLTGGGRMPNLSPWWADQYDPDNGGYGIFYDGWLFAGTAYGLDMISPDPSRLGLQQWCQPGAYESHENSPVYGRPVAHAIIDGWLFVAFKSPTKSYVMRGKLAERLGMRNRNPMVWYGPEFECAGTIRDIRVVSPRDTSHPRYVYYATDDASGTPHLYRQDFPREPTPYAAYRRGSPWRAYPSWSLTESAEDLGDPDAPKVARFYGAVAENLGDGNALTISTSTDVEASVDQATLTTSPRDYAVADTTSARGHMVTVTATAVNDPERPVFVRATKMRGTVNDEKTLVCTVPVEIGKDTAGNNGANGELRDARSQAARLYDLLEQGPVRLSDWLGRDLVVVVEDIEEEEVEDADRRGTTRVATVTYSVMLNYSRYGAAAVYGSGRYG